MIRLLLHSWLFSSRSPAGASRQQSVLSRMLQFLKKKYREIENEVQDFKNFKKQEESQEEEKQ